jgi:hypothetical protein
MAIFIEYLAEAYNLAPGQTHPWTLDLPTSLGEGLIVWFSAQPQYDFDVNAQFPQSLQVTTVYSLEPKGRPQLTALVQNVGPSMVAIYYLFCASTAVLTKVQR